MNSSKRILLSILVPAYNAVNFLPRCFTSIFKQYDERIELLFVDDGSKDDTFMIIHDYAYYYPWVQAYKKENEGVGAARNFLLEHARGEYIWFVDSDDFIIDGSLEKILDYLDGTIDFLSVSYNGKQLDPFVGTGLDFIKKGYFNGYLWSKIIRRSLIETNAIHFDSELCSQEDWFFLLHLYPLAAKIEQISLNAYAYCDDNKNSVMRGSGMEHKRKLIRDSRQTICNFKEYIKSIEGEPHAKYYEYWNNFSAAGYLYSLFPLDYDYNEVKRDLSIFREAEVYPVGRTKILKFDLFLKIVNHEWLYLLCLKIYRFMNK